MWAFITAVLDALLPRHPDAAHARRIAENELASLMQPKTLEGKKWIHTLWPYTDERVRAVIKAIKYYGERELASRVGALAADYIVELLDEKHSFSGWQNIVLAPIPSSSKRLRERGYNQAALIGDAIHKNISEAQYDPSLLQREDRTSQVHVMRSKRGENIRNAFTGDPRAAGAFVILIDDVTESGATLADARRALLDAGAKDVIAVAMAH